MAGQISEFTSNFTIGARANLFKVQITDVDQKIEFVCKAAQIPGKTINPIELKYLNNTIKVAGDPVFDDWTVTIMNDEDWAIRKRIDEWQEAIKANAEAKGDGALTDYFKDATVIQLNRDGSENSDGKYKFINLWPSAVDPMDMSFDSADTITEFGITFSYSHWEKA